MRVFIVAVIVFLSLVTIKANMQDNIKAKIQETIGSRRSGIHISVESETKTITLEVEPSDTIKSVKAMIQDKEGIPAVEQRLYYQNDELYDAYNLSHYGIKDGSVIYLEQD